MIVKRYFKKFFIRRCSYEKTPREHVVVYKVKAVNCDRRRQESESFRKENLGKLQKYEISCSREYVCDKIRMHL